jgi:hypothetical protein
MAVWERRPVSGRRTDVCFSPSYQPAEVLSKVRAGGTTFEHFNNSV